jgi:hypothetical protein
MCRFLSQKCAAFDVKSGTVSGTLPFLTKSGPLFALFWKMCRALFRFSTIFDPENWRRTQSAPKVIENPNVFEATRPIFANHVGHPVGHFRPVFMHLLSTIPTWGSL